MQRALAIVFREANKPTLEEVAIPDPKPTEAVVRTWYSGVSIGTESSIFSGVRTHNGTFPLVGGYMATGVVEEVGDEVARVKPGDIVVGGGGRLESEVNSVWGGHMSLKTMNAASLTPLPDGADPKEAALYVLMKMGLSGASVSGVNEEDRVLIFGQGLVGQFCGQFARNRGARIVTVEPSERRRALSKKYVTPDVLDPSDPSLDARIEEITEGQGPSVVVEASGSAEVITQASRHLRDGGRFVFLGWYPGEIGLVYHHFHAAAATAHFPMGGGGLEATRAVLDCLASGKLVVGDNLTDVVPVADAPQGYQRIIDGDRSIMGMVIDWSEK